jgi:hypothetical protein
MQTNWKDRKPTGQMLRTYSGVDYVRGVLDFLAFLHRER